ncbi:MAG: prolipoprotein diacylglyceryl transferase family protein [Ferruginibacter sp.]
MYPNLYYVFKDWFGVHWKGLYFLNTFGFMVAVSFVAAAIVLTKELRRKEKQGLLHPREEVITVGRPASLSELLMNGLAGFIFGYKLFGLFFEKPDAVNAQEYIFSKSGSIWGGLLLGLSLFILKWYEKNKQKLKEPERRTVRIWPHDRVGDIIILGLIFGILGAKIFDNLENWNEFIKDPIGRLFSQSGLTFYGGLIVATIAICWYAIKKGIKLAYLADAVAPALMIAYALGRIGCQVAGDGDWGVFNSAYISDANGKVIEANPGDFDRQLEANKTYFLEGKVPTGDSAAAYTDGHNQTHSSLAEVPHIYFKGPSFLPKWMLAYTYPKNVNIDGILIPGDKDEHNRVLPLPVFPTAFYETVMCLLLFLFLWAIRKKIRTAGVVFGIYLVLNGIERFLIEKIRVNNTYSMFGFHPTQAELISSGLVITGIIFIIVLKLRSPRTENI